MDTLEDEYAIGLDLGTTFSCIGVYKNGKVEIIPNSLGNNITPSIVIIDNNLDILVGEETSDCLVKKYDSCIYETKRLIGRNFSDKEVKDEIQKLTFKIIKSKDDNSPVIEIMNNGIPITYYPVEISSFIIKKMVQNAEKYLNSRISKLVITVPAYFNDSQRKLTKQAAELAGLKVLRVINEPTAAALAYGLDKKLQNNEKILIFDLGGGTFDVSIISIKKDENNLNHKVFQVLSTSGDMQLGGKDFDNKLVEYFLNKMDDKEEIKKDKKCIQNLKISCEKIKKDLSNPNTTETTLNIPQFFNKKDIIFQIKREEFEDICKDLFDKLDISLNRALINAQLTKDEINEVILVGGSTRIPKIREKLKKFFPKSNINNSINPDEAVAYGATLEAEKILHNKNVTIQNFLLKDVIPLSLGTNVLNKSKDPKILKEGDVMDVILKKGTPMNYSNSKEYSSVCDNQKEMAIDIYEGENAFVKYNHLLKKSTISGLKKRPKGETKVIVTFQIDINGILIVNAYEKSENNDGQKMIPIIIKNDEISLSEDKLKDLEKKNRELIKKIGNNDIKIEDYSNIKESLIKYKNAYIKAKTKYEEKLKHKQDEKKKEEEEREEEEEEQEEQDNRLIYISNFNETLEEFIDSFDIDNNCDNETVIEKYYLYIREIFLSYIETLKFDLKTKDQNNIIAKMKEYIVKFVNKNSDYLKNLLEIFYENLEEQKGKDKDKEKDKMKTKQNYSKLDLIFFRIVIYVMEKYNERGKNYIKSNEKYCKYYSLINYEQAKTYYEKYLSNIDPALLKRKDMDNFKKQKNLFEENIRDITNGAIVLCYESFKGGYLVGEEIKSQGRGITNNLKFFAVEGVIKEMDIKDLIKRLETYKIVLNQYEKILLEIQNSEDFKNNTKKEAICITNIIKLNQLIGLIEKKNRTLLRYAKRCKYIIDELIKKNKNKNEFENEKWYIEFNNLYRILKDKEPKYEEYHSILEKLQAIEKYKIKFDELEVKFNKRKTNMAFIKYFLQKYPYEELIEDKKNKGEDFFNNYSRELVNFLIEKYHPDNYDKYKSSGDEEMEFKYCIFHDISRKLNYLYTTPE